MGIKKLWQREFSKRVMPNARGTRTSPRLVCRSKSERSYFIFFIPVCDFFSTLFIFSAFASGGKVAFFVTRWAVFKRQHAKRVPFSRGAKSRMIHARDFPRNARCFFIHYFYFVFATLLLYFSPPLPASETIRENSFGLFSFQGMCV